MIRTAIATLLFISVAQAAHAQEAPVQAPAAPTQETVVQLSPEQREKVLEAAAINPRSEPTINGLGSGRQIHGEVGMAIGTGGMRSVYGTVEAPIGDNATASFSYENTRFNGRNGRRGYYY